MSSSFPNEQEVFPPRELALEGDLFSYIAVLTQRVPETLVFRTGSGRIFRDLLLHWPALEEWEEEAQDFCQHITDTVYPLTASLYAQAVEMTVVISSMPIEAPNHVDAMSTYLVFDLKSRIERHLFLSPHKPLPTKKIMSVPRGIAVFCRPLHYRYHTIKDDRKRGAHAHAGIFQLTERLINELYGLPNFDLPARDVMEQLKKKANALRLGVVRGEDARLAKMAKENDHELAVPPIVSVTSLSALPPAIRAFEGALLRQVTNKNLPPDFRLKLRQIAQILRTSSAPAMIEEAARTQTTPVAATIPLATRVITPPMKPQNQHQAATKAQPVSDKEIAKSTQLNIQPVLPKKQTPSSENVNSRVLPVISVPSRISAVALSVRPSILLPSTLRQRQQMTPSTVQMPQAAMAVHPLNKVQSSVQKMHRVENTKKQQAPLNPSTQNQLETQARPRSPQTNVNQQSRPAQEENTKSQSQKPQQSAPQQEPGARNDQSQTTSRQQQAEPQQKPSSRAETSKQSAPQQEPRSKPDQSQTTSRQPEPQNKSQVHQKIPEDHQRQNRQTLQNEEPQASCKQQTRQEDVGPSSHTQYSDRTSSPEIQKNQTLKRPELQHSVNSSALSEPQRDINAVQRSFQAQSQTDPQLRPRTHNATQSPSQKSVTPTFKEQFQSQPEIRPISQSHYTSSLREQIQSGGVQRERPAIFEMHREPRKEQFFKEEKYSNREDLKPVIDPMRHYIGGQNVRPLDFYRELKMNLSELLPKAIVVASVGKLEKTVQINRDKATLSPQVALHKQRLIETLPTLTPGPFMYFKGKK
jgi:hypothetical protein